MELPRAEARRIAGRGGRTIVRAAATIVALVCACAAARAQSDQFTSAFVASWNLNHGEYLVDLGEYLEAIEAFETATEMGVAVAVRNSSA